MGIVEILFKNPYTPKGTYPINGKRKNRYSNENGISQLRRKSKNSNKSDLLFNRRDLIFFRTKKSFELSDSVSVFFDDIDDRQFSR